MTNSSFARHKNRAIWGTVAVSLALVTSACSGTTEAASSSSPTAVAAAATASIPSTPPATTEPSKKLTAKTVYADRVSDGDRAKLIKGLQKDHISVSEKTVTNTKGSFPRLIVDADSPLATFDPLLLTTDLPDGWSKADATDAMHYAANFMLQGVIDSLMNGDMSDSAQAAWAKEFGSQISSESRSELLALTVDDQGLIAKEGWQDIGAYKGINYSYAYDGVTPRVSSVDMKVDSTREHNGRFVIYYSGKFAMDAYYDDGKLLQETDLKMTISINKNKSGFDVDGLETKYNTSRPNPAG